MYNNTNDLMTALDDAGMPSDQDWENETTTWTLQDGSRIVVSGSSVNAIQPGD